MRSLRPSEDAVNWGQAVTFGILGFIAGAIVAFANTSSDECTVVDKIVSTTTTVVRP